LRLQSKQKPAKLCRLRDVMFAFESYLPSTEKASKVLPELT